MSDIFDKISNYNLFNNLLPGIVLLYLLRITIQADWMPSISENVVEYFFLAYFVGLIISRFGSLIVEPAFKKFGFKKHGTYDDYLVASEKDSKIEKLSEEKNVYRSFIALLLLYFISQLFALLAEEFSWNKEYLVHGILLLLIPLFICAYIKQGNFIADRVENSK